MKGWIPLVADGLGLDFEDSASAEEEQLVGVVHEVPPVPDPGGEDERSEVEEEAVPVPDQFERVEHVVEEGDRDERLVCVDSSVQKM